MPTKRLRQGAVGSYSKVGDAALVSADNHLLALAGGFPIYTPAAYFSVVTDSTS